MRIEATTSGSTEELPFRELEETDKLGGKYAGRVFTFRDEAQNSQLERGTTEIAVYDDNDLSFAGRLNDVVYDGSTAELLCDSWEQDAEDHPLELGANATGTKFEQRYSSTQGERVFRDAVEIVGTLSEGTVDNIDYPHTLIYSNTTPGKTLRQLELADDRFVVYNYDQTVDFITSPGTDRTSTVLDPDSENVEGDIEVREDGFEDNYTDLLLLGAGSGGNDQLSVSRQLVANPDRQKELRLEYKNVYEESHLEDVADQVETEFSKDLQKVRLTIRGLSVDVGDEFQVTKTEEGVDDTFYVQSYERSLGSVDRYDVVLSTRRLFQEGDTEEVLTEIDNYRTSKEPPIVFLNGGGGNRSPVGPNNDWVMTQKYPEDVIHERDVTLNIKGRNYRAFSSGAAGGSSNIDTSESSQTTQEQSKVIEETGKSQSFDGNNNWKDIREFNVSENFDFFECAIQNIGTVGTAGGPIEFRLENAGNSLFKCAQIDTAQNNQSTTLIGDTRSFDTSGREIELQARSSDNKTFQFNYVVYSRPSHNHQINLPDHQHDPDPGIVDFDGSGGFSELYPENIDVVVNGNTVATDVAGDGSSPFEVEVDLGGELSAGFNEIEIQSESLGHIEAALGGRLALKNTLG